MPSNVYIDRTAEHERDFAEAALCACIRKLGLDAVLTSIDKESGLKPDEITKWWESHQRKDEERRQRETAQKVSKVVRAIDKHGLDEVFKRPKRRTGFARADMIALYEQYLASQEEKLGEQARGHASAREALAKLKEGKPKRG